MHDEDRRQNQQGQQQNNRAQQRRQIINDYQKTFTFKPVNYNSLRGANFQESIEKANSHHIESIGAKNSLAQVGAATERYAGLDVKTEAAEQAFETKILSNVAKDLAEKHITEKDPGQEDAKKASLKRQYYDALEELKKQLIRGEYLIIIAKKLKSPKTKAQVISDIKKALYKVKIFEEQFSDDELGGKKYYASNIGNFLYPGDSLRLKYRVEKFVPTDNSVLSADDLKDRKLQFDKVNSNLEKIEITKAYDQKTFSVP